MTPIEVTIVIAGALAAAFIGCGIVALVLRALDRRYDRECRHAPRPLLPSMPKT